MKIQVRKPSEVAPLLKDKRISYDIETLNTELETEVCLISIFDIKDKQLYILPLKTKNVILDSDLEYKSVQEIFTNSEVMGHYLQFDNSVVLSQFKVKPKAFADTFILARMLQEPKQSLKDLAKKYIPQVSSLIHKFTEVISQDVEGNFIYNLADKSTLVYSALDALLPVLIHKHFEKDINFKEIKKAYDLEIRFLSVVVDWRTYGLNFDMNLYNSSIPKLGQELESNLQELYQLAGRQFKLNSPKDLQKLLFEEHGLTPVLTTKSGAPSTNQEALSYFEGNPLVDKLLKVKSDDSVYRASLKVPQFVDSNSHLRFSVEQLGFDGTSRVYTKDTSVNQLPRSLRYAIKPSEGKKFLYFDLSSAELYILAYFAECIDLLEWYENGIDIHTKIGERLLGRPLKDRKEREISKVCSFAVLYGSKGAAVSRALKVSQSEGERLVEQYLASFPEISRYKEKNEQYTIKTGYTKTPIGRLRKLSYAGDTSPGVLRQATNTAIQGGCADFIKYMMCRAERLKPKGINVKFSVFDSMLLEVPLDFDEPQAPKLLDWITDVSKLFPNMKFNYEYAFGMSWGEAQSKC